MIIRKGSTGGASKTYSATSTTNLLNSTLGNGVFEKKDTHAEYIDYVSRKYVEASANGTISLKSGATKLGAKQINVSPSGNNVYFYLKSPKYGKLDEVSLYSASQGENTWTFNCSDYSEAQLENAYIEVVMNSFGKADGNGMSLHSEVRATATIKFNYIRVTY